MRDKLFRSIAFAVVAAITVGVAPSLASVDALSNDGNNIIADGMFMQKQCRRVYKRTSSCATKKATKKACVQAKPAAQTVIEKPVVIEKQVEAPAPAATETTTTVTQPAVVESSTPVIIDRFEKRHKSLIHLGLFPINLLGQ
jgi:hypothetical protein